MDKTLHRKLTEKHHYNHTQTISFVCNEDVLSGLAEEMKILHAAGNDLLQPRPEAIARLLKMAREV